MKVLQFVMCNGHLRAAIPNTHVQGRSAIFLKKFSNFVMLLKWLSSRSLAKFGNIQNMKVEKS
jgi:hypothetical protein